MGTRGLVVVVKDGEYKVAQYTQFDMYLSGAGKTIKSFIEKLLSAPTGLSDFKAQVAKTRTVSEGEVQARWKECGADDSGFVSMDIAHAFKAKHPQLARECGADILPYIATAENPEVKQDLDFAGDSLFCEYAYVVNLDTEELEIFTGCNERKLGKGQRFAFLNAACEKTARAERAGRVEYYPVRHYKTFKFSEIPDMEALEEKYYKAKNARHAREKSKIAKVKDSQKGATA